VKPYKKYEDKADRKAKVAQKNILREKRFRALESEKFIFLEDNPEPIRQEYRRKR
jgi:hypothetical protein